MLRRGDKSKYLNLRRIPKAEVRLLWDVDYYDLPLEGVAEWKGNKYWFSSIAEEVPDQNEFFLIKLPKSEMKKIEDLQQLRELMHDASNRHDDRYSNRWKWEDLKDGNWTAAYEESKHLFEEFIVAARSLPQPDLDLGEVIGWCFWKEPETQPNGAGNPGSGPSAYDL
jgi:hypothetical protein